MWYNIIYTGSLYRNTTPVSAAFPIIFYHPVSRTEIYTHELYSLINSGLSATISCFLPLPQRCYAAVFHDTYCFFLKSRRPDQHVSDISEREVFAIVSSQKTYTGNILFLSITLGYKITDECAIALLVVTRTASSKYFETYTNRDNDVRSIGWI